MISASLAGADVLTTDPCPRRDERPMTNLATTREASCVSDRSAAPCSALHRALERISAEIREGVRHGFCEYTVTCEIVSGGKRRLVLHAGKNYQFHIGANECEVTTTGGDPHHEGANQSNA